MILELEKVRALSRFLVRKGLDRGDPDVLASHFQNLLVVTDSHHYPTERTKGTYDRHLPLVLKRVEHGCGSTHYRAKPVQRDPDLHLHDFSPLKGDVLDGTLPQRSA